NVLDPVSLTPWYNGPAGSPGQYGSDAVCGADRAWNFQYNILDANKRQKAAEFLDLVPDGHYVVVRNCSGSDPATNTYASTWQNDPVSFCYRLKDQGFATIDSFYRPRAFVFVYKKNDSEFVPRTVF